ncbi:unnamed protein product [Aureobasidium pullulans]|nr:unnamed protein product [Aureobasidium pullulans]
MLTRVIGGTIGTGLFIGSGGALANAGPAGALIAYAFVGTLVYSVMVALGEMATFLPVSGAFTAYAARFVDPSLGFAMGWIYWFSWAITYALELTASGLIIQYWRADLNIGIFIGIFWAVITAVNFLPVSFYGEIEFYFASIKVLTVIGFMIFAICIDAGAGQHGYLGFDTWKNPGAFAPYLVENNEAVAKFVGFWAVLIQAGFSYQGTELVGIAAGETSNPRKTVPAAIKKTFYRIVFFFVLTIFFIGLLVPYDNEGLLSDTTDASSSPFVIAANLAGVKVLPSIINVVLLCVVLSAANSNVYSGSRIWSVCPSSPLGTYNEPLASFHEHHSSIGFLLSPSWTCISRTSRCTRCRGTQGFWYQRIIPNLVMPSLFVCLAVLGVLR